MHTNARGRSTTEGAKDILKGPQPREHTRICERQQQAFLGGGGRGFKKCEKGIMCLWPIFDRVPQIPNLIHSNVLAVLGSLGRPFGHQNGVSFSRESKVPSLFGGSPLFINIKHPQSNLAVFVKNYTEISPPQFTHLKSCHFAFGRLKLSWVCFIEKGGPPNRGYFGFSPFLRVRVPFLKASTKKRRRQVAAKEEKRQSPFNKNWNPQQCATRGIVKTSGVTRGICKNR